MSRFYTDEPARDFDRWDMEQARREARLPVCEKCKKRIKDDDYFDVYGEILCEEHMKEKFRMSTEAWVNANE
jgi:NAD-dependent SIR2 family protein deacetylase